MEIRAVFSMVAITFIFVFSLSKFRAGAIFRVFVARRLPEVMNT